MTDASQGKTTPNNVVDLTNCTSHQLYYTALSRSASAAGTVIVQSFSPGPTYYWWSIRMVKARVL